MLDNQPELQIIDVFVSLSKTPKERRVAFGSLVFGIGERKILAKGFTVFRSERTGALYVSWPAYTSQVDGKTVYKDWDMWFDVEESKYWVARILDETNRKLGVNTTTNSDKSSTPPKAPDTPQKTDSEPPTPPARKVGWAGQKKS